MSTLPESKIVTPLPVFGSLPTIMLFVVVLPLSVTLCRLAASEPFPLSGEASTHCDVFESL